MSQPFRFMVSLVVASLLAACGDDDPGGPSGIDELSSGFNVIVPGGDTTCSRGTPFQYLVRRGSVNRVLIEFRGGGACWNDVTCSFAGSLFQETADADEYVLNEESGIYQHSNADNPFADWHHVYIPYCTGDVHWGDATRTYDTGDEAYEIQHKGAVNARTVLDWVYENVPNPEKVFVAGCSAGAYGAIMWSAHVRDHYTNAKVYQLADSGAGVITDTFFQDSFPQWNAQASYPTFAGLDPAAFSRLPELYATIGAQFPDMFLSQYNTVYDENQAFFYRAMGGGDVHEWSEKMQSNVAEIDTTTPSFRSYLAPDYKHCILPYPEFYSVESGGVRLVDWIRDIIDDEPVESVSCGSDCGGPIPPPMP